MLPNETGHLGLVLLVRDSISHIDVHDHLSAHDLISNLAVLIVNVKYIFGNQGRCSRSSPTLADMNKKEIIAFALQVQWFTSSDYTVVRERAQSLGDSSQGGAWVDRVKIPAGKRILAHTHPQDELVTVIAGTWYPGEKIHPHETERVATSPTRADGLPTRSVAV